MYNNDMNCFLNHLPTFDFEYFLRGREDFLDGVLELDFVPLHLFV